MEYNEGNEEEKIIILNQFHIYIIGGKDNGTVT